MGYFVGLIAGVLMIGTLVHWLAWSISKIWKPLGTVFAVLAGVLWLYVSFVFHQGWVPDVPQFFWLPYMGLVVCAAFTIDVRWKDMMRA